MYNDIKSRKKAHIKMKIKHIIIIIVSVSNFPFFLFKKCKRKTDSKLIICVSVLCANTPVQRNVTALLPGQELLTGRKSKIK